MTAMEFFTQSPPNVSFSACDNTRIAMVKAEGKQPADIPLAENARLVTADVARLIELQEQGWAYIKP